VYQRDGRQSGEVPILAHHPFSADVVQSSQVFLAFLRLILERIRQTFDAATKTAISYSGSNAERWREICPRHHDWPHLFISSRAQSKHTVSPLFF
jgi:hypothetical protein